MWGLGGTSRQQMTQRKVMDGLWSKSDVNVYETPGDCPCVVSLVVGAMIYSLSLSSCHSSTKLVSQC